MRSKMVAALLTASALLTLLLTSSSVVASPPWQGPDVEGETITAAFVDEAINYQGRLTDSGGSPLDGSYDFTFQLWDGPDTTTDSQVGSDISVTGVTVTDGLFNVKIPVTQADLHGRALWLRVKVGTDDWMTPLQEILPVPYALSLRPGADIRDDANRTTLYVRNAGVCGIYSGTHPKIAVRGCGEGKGVYGEGGDVGVAGFTGEGTGVEGYSHTGTAVYASGTGRIKSTANSYLWIPGNQAVRNTYETGLDIMYGWSGTAAFRANSTGDYYVIVPIDVPGVLYGQNVTVEEARIYYKVENSADYIGWTRLRKNTGAGETQILVEELATNRNSTSPTHYTLTPTANNVLDNSAGGLCLSLSLHFAGTGGTREILIGGVRVKISHD